MPHKRPKKSVRDADIAAHGFDNAPTSNESYLTENGGNDKEKHLGGVSKTVYRILNAERIRSDRKARDAENKGRPRTDNGEAAGGERQAKKLKINPGENLKSFNGWARHT